MNSADVGMAQGLAIQKGMENISFEVANIYELPYPDDTFDAASILAVLSHLKNPVDALTEIRRVLRPGGVIGASRADFGGALLAPDEPIMLQSIDVLCKVMQHRGGEPFAGRNVRRTLREAGFARVEGSGSVRCYASTDATPDYGPRVAGLVRSVADQTIEIGLVDSSTIQNMLAAWQDWGDGPDAFFLLPWGEAVGWKE